MTELPQEKRSNEAHTGLYCTFRLAEHLFGVPILDVKEVNAATDFTPIPHAPAEVRGYVNLRGSIFLVLDLRLLLGLERDEVTADSRLVLFKPAVGESFAVLVGSIGDIARLDGDRIERDRPRDNLRGNLIVGVGKLDDELLILLEPRRFLKAIERASAV